jgi:hypothetical protein
VTVAGEGRDQSLLHARAGRESCNSTSVDRPGIDHLLNVHTTAVELEDAVSPKERPITATGQHLSAQPRALEVGRSLSVR